MREGATWAPKNVARAILCAQYGGNAAASRSLLAVGPCDWSDPSSSAAEERDEAILALAPVLLLLTQDRLLAPSLTPKRRYVPPLAAIVVYLLANAANDVLVDPYDSPASRAFDIVGALCPVPALAMLGVYLWTWRRRSEWPLLFLGPLSVLAGLVAQSTAVKLLSGLSIVGIIGQSVAMRRVQRIGTQLI
jgi:hypothetical protein